MELSQNASATVAQSHRKPVSSAPRRPRRERQRYNGNSPEHYRVKALAAALKAQLGDVVVDPILAAAITRAAELLAVAEQIRGQRLRGEVGVTVGDIVKIENAARRAVADLGIKPAAEREEQSDLATYLAERYGERDAEEDGTEAGKAGPVTPVASEETLAADDDNGNGAVPEDEGTA